MFCVYLYAISLLLAVVAVRIIENSFKWCGISMLLIALSMGIYQSYVSVTVVLFVLLLIRETFLENVNFKLLLKKSLMYLGTLLGGGILYLLCTKFFCWFKGEELSSYKGINSMEKVSSSGLALNNNMEMSYNMILKAVFGIVLLISFVICVYWICILWKKNKLVSVLFMLYIPALLIAMNVMYFLGMSNEDIYLLMLYSYVFVLLFPIIMLKWISIYLKKTGNIWNGISWLTALCLVGAIYSYIAYANGQYLSMELSWSQAKGYYTVMVDQIKSTEGYTDEMPVMIGGDEIEDKHFYDNSIMGVFDVKGRSATYLNI